MRTNPIRTRTRSGLELSPLQDPTSAVDHDYEDKDCIRMRRRIRRKKVIKTRTRSG